MSLPDNLSGNESVYRWRLVGYGLLLFFLVDTLCTLVPVSGFNNAWMFQTTGVLVERVVIPLLGMAFVFFGEFYARRKLEIIGLKILSWLSLLFAIVYLLLLVPLIGNTLQLNAQLNQTPQPLVELGKIEERVTQSNPQGLEQLANHLIRSGVAIEKTKPEGIRKQILSQIKNARPKIEAQLSKFQQQVQQQNAIKKMSLFRDTIRWGIGTVLASVLFFLIWQGTHWARFT